MPAVARKVTPNSHQNYRIVDDERLPERRSTPVKVAPPRNRWHESPPKKTGARSTPSRARREENDSADLRGLLDHFTGENAARTQHQQKEVEARRAARKRSRLRHRPFRMTVLASAMVGAPLALLACLLWMKSSSLAFSREDETLRRKIAATRSELDRTREEITAVNASPQVGQWAKERGWRRADQNDFDNVSKFAQSNRDNISRENSAP